jgi:HAD superfamily hydrolase (TIGR01459 family)
LTQPPIIPGFRALAPGYDLILSDVWGVLHNGERAHPAAGEALARFRADGGVVVLISNAPMPGGNVIDLLDRLKVRRDSYDAILTSGDLTRAWLVEAGYDAVHHLGTDRDDALFTGLKTRKVGLADADALVCTGLFNEFVETPEEYRPSLAEARGRGLEMLCANPDLVVEVGPRLIPCAGALAVIYEELGGRVRWAGKPRKPVYEQATAMGADILGREPERARMLAIGDALRTDMAGAAGFGIDALFIADGIHAGELVREGAIDPAALERAFAAAGLPARGAMAKLAW